MKIKINKIKRRFYLDSDHLLLASSELIREKVDAEFFKERC